MHPNIRHFMKNHPELVRGLDPESFDDALKFQEQFRVATIKDVIFDEDKDVWKAIIERHPDFLDKELPPFCSVAIFQEDMTEPEGHITKWKITHLAGLMERPAYGSQALHEGTCNDTLGNCVRSFSNARDILMTDIKLAKQKFAAVLSTDNPAVNVVPVFGLRKKKKRNLTRN